jgi:hypothetical protein
MHDIGGNSWQADLGQAANHFNTPVLRLPDVPQRGKEDFHIEVRFLTADNQHMSRRLGS